MLHLVRHGRPAIDPTLPACEWPLSPDAAPGLAELRSRSPWPDSARWFSSTERKAVETARALTGTSIGFVEGLREAGRGLCWYDDLDAWRGVVGRFLLEGEVGEHLDWEPRDAVTKRIVAAVERILDSFLPPADSYAEPVTAGPAIGDCEQDVVLVGHATAWTLLIAHLTGKPPDVEQWSAIGMPDHCAIDLKTTEVVSQWGEWQR